MVNVSTSSWLPQVRETSHAQLIVSGSGDVCDLALLVQAAN